MEAPSGEMSWALFLEYIEGPTLMDEMDEMKFKTGGFNDKMFAEIEKIVS